MSDYTERVEQNLKGLEAVSTGACPGCAECADRFGCRDLAAYNEEYEAGRINDEGGFSWSGCGICGNPLGNTLYSWHAIDSNGELVHFDDACSDCVIYIANGEEPETE